MSQNLKRPESIPGYQHPTEDQYISSSSQTIYKTFTEGKRQKKDEKFGNTQTVTKYSISQTILVEQCPICQEGAIYICPCANSDKKCSNNHVWYVNRDGKTITGNPHK